MLEIIIYSFIGLISGFITYWVSYRMVKKKLDDSVRYIPVTHDEIKGKVLEEDMIPIILSILAWPIALFIVYPAIGLVIGVCKTFNWMIDKIEGSKFK